MTKLTIHVHVQPFSLDIETHSYAASHLPSYPVLHPVCLPLVISNTGGVHCTILTLSVDILVCASTVLVHASMVLACVLKGLARASMNLACSTVLIRNSTVLTHSTVLARALTVLTCDSTGLTRISVAVYGVSSCSLHETRYGQYCVLGVSTSYL